MGTDSFGRMTYTPPNIGAGIFWGSVLLTVAMIVLTVYLFRLSRPWVELHADRTHVRVGNLLFDRAHYGGMRIGYEIDTTQGMLKNDFHDIDLGLQGLRLVYGPWGEDLPWLVSKYHASEIVLWLNGKIAETAPPAPEKINVTGRREHRFEAVPEYPPEPHREE